MERKRFMDAFDRYLPMAGAKDRKCFMDALDRHLQTAAAMNSKRIKDDYDRYLRTAAEQSPSSSAAPEPKEPLDSDRSACGSSEADDTCWIKWFCAMRGNELFAEVDENYIQDDFKLWGLSTQVPFYDHALDLILEPVLGDAFPDGENELIVESAEMLYGLIHARYILTAKGLAVMLDKFNNCDFGKCPRVSCSGQPCLPMGQFDMPRSGTVKIYCPKCEDLYCPRSKLQANADGAYFGTTFPRIFMMTYPQLKPQKPAQQYVPRIFGFKVHKET